MITLIVFVLVFFAYVSIYLFLDCFDKAEFKEHNKALEKWAKWKGK